MDKIIGNFNGLEVTEFDSILERGSASMFLEMSAGVLTVRHGTDDVLLFSGKISLGTWDAIWDVIKQGEVE